MLNRNALLSAGLCASILLNPVSAHAGDCSKPGLDSTSEFSSDGVNYNIFYTTEAGDSDRVSEGDVDDMEAMILSGYDAYVNVMNFPAPHQAGLPEYDVILKDDWYYAEPSCIVMHAPGIRNNPETTTRYIWAHELFHGIQRTYMCDVRDCDSGYIGSTFGKWVAEGTADVMMDKVYSDIDDLSGGTTFEASSRNALTSPEDSFFDRSYSGCLFWNYLMEQLGAIDVEPRIGVDFMRRFWDTVAANGQDGSAAQIDNLRQTIAAYTTLSLEDLYLFHAIANIAREFDATGIANPSRYTYIDELTRPMLDDVPRRATYNNLPASDSNVSISSYAAHYYAYEVKGIEVCEVLGVSASSDQAMGFAFLAVDASDKIVALRYGRGNAFAASIFNSFTRNVDRVFFVAVGLNADADYDFTMDGGQIDIDIQDPTFQFPAYPGEHSEPNPIVASVIVNGPAGLAPPGFPGLSVQGLVGDDFAAFINGSEVNILNANYVGGEYQLLLDTEDPGANGLYDLRIELCSEAAFGGVYDVEQLSVLFGQIEIDHAVTIDISGSMIDPGPEKFQAAKEAAKFYIDAINDGDSFTVVSFTGDGAECNEDADNWLGFSGITSADTASRGQAKEWVQSLGAASLTSIGDGIWEAQNALDNAPPPSAGALSFQTILLLSDGQENEARFWDALTCSATSPRDRVVAADTIVNTIAFGDGADEALMQSIAAVTDGRYRFIAVDPNASSAGTIAPSMNLTPHGMVSTYTLGDERNISTMQNQLTLSFLQGYERAEDLQRLALVTDVIGSGENLTLEVLMSEDEVANGRVYVGWADSKGELDVTITDPNGQNLDDYAPRYKGDSHTIWHTDGVKLPAGVYVVDLSSNLEKTTEFFMGISGQPQTGLRSELTFAQVPVPLDAVGGRRDSQERFQQGVPVDIRMKLFDNKGMVRNAAVDLTVFMPDGTRVCGPLGLFDDGANADGPADNGMYGFRFTRTHQASAGASSQQGQESSQGERGTYTVVVTLTGRANDGSAFNRSIVGSFQVYRRSNEKEQPNDYDSDGLPDPWEIYYNTNPFVNDADLDHDGDGLKAFEEFENGTDPFDADTDEGGESDGSEVMMGRCPLTPVDDALPAPIEASIISGRVDESTSAQIPFALLLNFPDHSSYEFMEVYRSKLPDDVEDPANLVSILDLRKKNLNEWYDEGLSDGVTYFYKLRALGVDGSQSAFSRLFSGVAKADHTEPAGMVILNNGATKTDDTDVVARLTYSPDAKDFRVSLDPGFPGASAAYQPVKPEFDISLLPINPGETAIVYVQFRNGVGNESAPVDDTIEYRPFDDSDNDGELDVDDADNDDDGLKDSDEIRIYGTDPYDADSDGDGFGDGVEVEAGSNPLDSTSVPQGDLDGDGVGNNLEAKYRTDLNDKTDFPTFSALWRESSTADFDFGIFGVSGVFYDQLFSDDLQIWTPTGVSVEGKGSTFYIEITLDPNESREFYRWAPRAEP